MDKSQAAENNALANQKTLPGRVEILEDVLISKSCDGGETNVEERKPKVLKKFRPPISQYRLKEQKASSQFKESQEEKKTCSQQQIVHKSHLTNIQSNGQKLLRLEHKHWQIRKPVKCMNKKILLKSATTENSEQKASLSLPILNEEVLEKIISELEKSKNDRLDVRRTIPLNESPGIAPKMFKRSLSCERLIYQPQEENPEQNKCHQLERNFNNQLINEMDKSAGPPITAPVRDKIGTIKFVPNVDSNEPRVNIINREKSSTLSARPNISETSEQKKTKADETEISVSIKSNIQSESNLNLTKVSSSQLMPWSAKRYLRINWKYDICFRKMMSQDSLTALFKCMHSKCSFATFNAEIFFNHLDCHVKDLRKKNFFFLYCSYCTYKSPDSESLVHHINDVHRRDVFQCSECFYRSREKETCYQHIRKSHKNSQAKIYHCPGPEPNEQELAKIITRLERKRDEFVAPSVCKLCDMKFYLLDEFIEHLEVHIASKKSAEKKAVKKMMKKMQNMLVDHSYGRVQCLFCVFGTETEQKLSRHLVKHSSELHYCCLRQTPPNFKNCSPQSVDSTCIFKIPLNVNVDVISISKAAYSSDSFKRVIDRDLLIHMPRNATKKRKI